MYHVASCLYTLFFLLMLNNFNFFLLFTQLHSKASLFYEKKRFFLFQLVFVVYSFIHTIFSSFIHASFVAISFQLNNILRDEMMFILVNNNNDDDGDDNHCDD